jgi:ADP-ribose pyrophosphatase YjhB (NUDIX family)
MSSIAYGERIGRRGKILVGCSAVIFDEMRNKVLLTRRADNGKWCLPSGHMEPGESAEEACIREVREETGLAVRLTRLAGIYTDPDRLLEYPDGGKYHLVALNFEAEITGGELTAGDETTDFGYFSLREIAALDMMDIHVERIEDALKAEERAFMK